VYRDDAPVSKSFINFGTYLALFPQLIAGPIVRYRDVAEQMIHRRETLAMFTKGVKLFCVGLAKKVLIANQMGALTSAIITSDDNGVLGTWVGIIGYTFQIYFDFSGYSDMAIGIGRIFGFHFDENFRHPFMCRSISEFWQRWHISLGSFFRDYLLYLPIFGKRRAVLSLFLVWFTTGLWHGASWNYVIWGLYFGVFIYIETLIGKKRLKNAPTALMHIYNKFVILLGFGIFKFESSSDLLNFFKNLVGANGNELYNEKFFTVATTNLFIVIVALIACFPIIPYLKKRFENSSPTIYSIGIITATVLAILLLFVNTSVLVKTFSSNNPFLYWNF
jgi:alginate O-acetyltransferase complex protein AlgI